MEGDSHWSGLLIVGCGCLLTLLLAAHVLTGLLQLVT